MNSRAHVGREFQTIGEVCLDGECNVCLILVEQGIAINSSKIRSPRDDLGQRVPNPETFFKP